MFSTKNKRLFAIFLALAMIASCSVFFSFAEDQPADGHFYVKDQNNTVYNDGDTIEIPLGYAAFIVVDNTYQKNGLPIGPICNPGKSSILAVMHPVQTDYLFFVAKGDLSGHVFAKTFEGHSKNIKEQRRIKPKVEKEVKEKEEEAKTVTVIDKKVAKKKSTKVKKVHTKTKHESKKVKTKAKTKKKKNKK